MVGCMPHLPFHLPHRRGKGWGEKEIATQAKLIMGSMLEEYNPSPADAETPQATNHHATAEEAVPSLLGSWQTLSGESLVVLGAQLLKVSKASECVWEAPPQSLRLVSSSDPSLRHVTSWVAVSIQQGDSWLALHSYEDVRQLLASGETVSMQFVPPPEENAVTGSVHVAFRQGYAPLGPIADKRERSGKFKKALLSASFGSTAVLLCAPMRDQLVFYVNGERLVAFRLPEEVSEWPTMPLAASLERRSRREDWQKAYSQKVLYVAIGLNSAKVSSVKPKFLLRTLVQAATDVSPIAGELAKRVTYEDVLGEENDEDDDLHMILAWSKANINGDTVVDARELGELNVEVRMCPPDVREALSLRRAEGKGLTFGEFRKLWTDLIDVPELRAEFSSKETHGKLSPSALQTITNEPNTLTQPISFAEFIRFMKGTNTNGALKQIHQDMTHDIKDYFFATSHNTYLKGHQLWGNSSAEQYKDVILQGCRCVEVDVWDASDGNGVVVTHGYTATSKVPLSAVLTAVNDAAFEQTDLPLLVSVEDHTSPLMQSELAKQIKQAFGTRLLSRSDNVRDMRLGSLRHKILIKCRSGIPELNDLITLPGGDDWPSDEANRVVSVSESRMDAITPHDTMARLYRVYPRGTRFDSENYDAQEAFSAGVQLIAMNYQKVDAKLRAYLHRFSTYNDNSGYILKPACLRSLPSNDSLTIRVDVLRAWRLPHGFARHKTGDPYVTVELHGPKGDMAVSKRLCTEAVKQNGFNPTWINSTQASCTFTTRSAGLSCLVLQVMDTDPFKESFDFLLAEAVLPMACIKPGMRSLRLHSAKGVPLKDSGLLCRFTIISEKPEDTPLALPSGDDGGLVEVLATSITDFHQDTPAPPPPQPSPAASTTTPPELPPNDYTSATPGYPAVVNFTKGWVLSSGALCSFVSNEGNVVRDVPQHRVTPLRPPDEMEKILKVPRVAWLWAHLVRYYAEESPGRVCKAAEIAAKYAGEEHLLRQHLAAASAGSSPRHADRLAFLVTPPPQEVSAQEKDMCLRLALRLKERRRGQSSTQALLEERDHEIRRLRAQQEEQQQRHHTAQHRDVSLDFHSVDARSPYESVGGGAAAATPSPSHRQMSSSRPHRSVLTPPSGNLRATSFARLGSGRQQSYSPAGVAGQSQQYRGDGTLQREHREPTRQFPAARVPLYLSTSSSGSLTVGSSPYTRF